MKIQNSVKMKVTSKLITFFSSLFFFFFSFFLLNPTVNGSLFPSTLDHHPPHPLEDLFRLDNFLPDPFKILEHLPLGFELDDYNNNNEATTTRISSAMADWKETPNTHVITLDVPGFKKNELNIEIENNRVLRVTGEKKKSDGEEEKTHWHCLERSAYGKFIRQFRLPENVDLDSVNAKMENGVLTIGIAKLSPDRIKGPKVIPVLGGGGGGAELSSPAVEAKEEL